MIGKDGGVLRDELGRCLSAFLANLGRCSITRAELQGVIMGLRERGARRVAVQSDSKVALALINGTEEACHQHIWEMSTIRMLLQREWEDALEIRTYLHDRALMNYGDKLESSGKGLPELIALGNELASQFGMKRGHIARFLDKTNACTEPMSKSEAFPIRNPHAPSRNESLVQRFASVTSRKMPSMLRYSAGYNTSFYDKSIDQSVADFKIKDGYVFKGVVASGPAEPRACGCIAAPQVVEQVAPYSSIENITVQKLTPEYKIGMARLLKTKAPPMKVSELWRDKPAIFLCVRRPGCIMCRAEAHQLYAKKPIFDSMGIQLFAVLLEHIESEVQEFWPSYWGGMVLYDHSMDFFKALGGGSLLKDKFISGFLFNPRAISNNKRAKAMGLEQNFKGEGEIKGGLLIVGRKKSGIAYQFVERNFGDWAPIAEVIGICNQLQNQQQDRGDQSMMLSIQEYA
ncbi:Peroxiredoxin-like 2A [Linum perenne]